MINFQVENRYIRQQFNDTNETNQQAKISILNCPIITHEPVDRFASKCFDWVNSGEPREYS